MGRGRPVVKKEEVKFIRVSLNKKSHAAFKELSDQAGLLPSAFATFLINDHINGNFITKSRKRKVD